MITNCLWNHTLAALPPWRSNPSTPPMFPTLSDTPPDPAFPDLDGGGLCGQKKPKDTQAILWRHKDRLGRFSKLRYTERN